MTSNIDQLKSLLKIQCIGDDAKYNEIIAFLKSKHILEENALSEVLSNSINIPNINNISRLVTPRYNKQYLELRIIGRGGFGDVFISKYYLDRKIYAIKKIPIYEEDLTHIETYLSEILILSRLEHKNIVRYYTSWIEIPDTTNQYTTEELSTDILPLEYSKFKDLSLSITANSIPSEKHVIDLYIQMELCKHFNLATILSTLSSVETFHIIKEIIQGVKYLHSKNIIHRDIKPANILFSLETNTIKLADFGLSCLEHSDQRTTGVPTGTYLYIDPDGDNYSKSYDIYSLGVVITELICKFKTRMERIESLKKLKMGVVPEYLEKNIKNIIKKCVCYNVNERYTILELEEIISNIK
uniref:non-specific serine/threonine protein kinase n=1 Tax=viral metagenome TaxID=1070528 RepID=A0A6C0B4G8_9ZZZZ